jgi:hypothetical protein
VEFIQAILWFHGKLDVVDSDVTLYHLVLLVPVLSAATGVPDERLHRLVPFSHVSRLNMNPDALETFDGTFYVPVTIYHTLLTQIMRRCGCAVAFGVDDLQHPTHLHDVQNTGEMIRLPASAPCPLTDVRYNDDVPRRCLCSANERRWNSPWRCSGPTHRLRPSKLSAHTHYALPLLRRAEDFASQLGYR